MKTIEERAEEYAEKLYPVSCAKPNADSFGIRREALRQIKEAVIYGTTLTTSERERANIEVEYWKEVVRRVLDTDFVVVDQEIESYESELQKLLQQHEEKKGA